MDALFSNGYVIDLVIAVLALEAVVVNGWLQRRAALPWPTVVSGLGLLIAWRCAHAGAHWVWIALPLSLAGMAHLLDLRLRWNQK